MSYKQFLMTILVFNSVLAAVTTKCLTFHHGLCSGTPDCLCSFGEKCGASSTVNVTEILRKNPAATCESQGGHCYNTVVGQCPGSSSCRTYYDRCDGSGPHPLPPIPGRYGIDMSTPLDASNFNCLKQENITFMVARVHESTGHIDNVGIQNIKTASTVGNYSLAGYLFPCVPCGNGGAQVDATVAALKAAGVLRKMDYIWFDIEPYHWGSHASNKAFVNSMITAANKYKGEIKFGIYGNWNGWTSIFGSRDGYTAPADNGYPVWWALYDGKPSFEGFQPFGGWKQGWAKQFYGDATQCGVDVDLSWRPL